MKPGIETTSLQDQVVLITGGARRVGAEIARALHAAGANILIHYRSSAAAATSLAESVQSSPASFGGRSRGAPVERGRPGKIGGCHHYLNSGAWIF